MATETQVSYYNDLCEEIGQKPEDDFENESVKEAIKAIGELKRMVRSYKDKFEGKEDNCY